MDHGVGVARVGKVVWRDRTKLGVSFQTGRRQGTARALRRAPFARGWSSGSTDH